MYPRPKEKGGVLIRRVIGVLRKSGFELPLTSHILLTVSGGSDSTALTYLIAKYGHRISHKNRISILHINHGWRGAESDQDEVFVRRLSEKFELPFYCRRAPKAKVSGESPEAAARDFRYRAIREIAEQLGAGTRVFTAHQADDLAETLLWRLFTGTSETHGGGILFYENGVCRPFLSSRKSELIEFLAEEEVSWREDPTNTQGPLLRARIRREILPAVESVFPRAIEHLVNAGVKAQEESRLVPSRAPERTDLGSAGHWLFSAAGLKLRRNQIKMVQTALQDGNEKTWSMPNGWILKHRPKKLNRNGEIWSLESGPSDP